MPTDEQRALWAAIRAEPLDDTPRLVYADWLDEHGDPDRAEFIRVQIELARTPRFLNPLRPGVPRCKTPGYSALSARSHHLQATNRKEWTQSLVGLVHGEIDRRDRQAVKQARLWAAAVRFDRGFPLLYLDTRQMARILSAPSWVEPIGCRVWEGAGGECRVETVASVSDWEHAAWVDGICLTGGDEVVAALVSGERLAHLRDLRLSGGSITDAGLTRLTRWPPLASVKDLALDNNRIGDPGVVELAASPLVAGIKWLRLHNNLISDAGAAALARSPYLNQIVYMPLYDNPITPLGRDQLQARFGSGVSLR